MQIVDLEQTVLVGGGTSAVADVALVVVGLDQDVRNAEAALGGHDARDRLTDVEHEVLLDALAGRVAHRDVVLGLRPVALGHDRHDARAGGDVLELEVTGVVGLGLEAARALALTGEEGRVELQQGSRNGVASDVDDRAEHDRTGLEDDVGALELTLLADDDELLLHLGVLLVLGEDVVVPGRLDLAEDVFALGVGGRLDRLALGRHPQDHVHGQVVAHHRVAREQDRRAHQRCQLVVQHAPDQAVGHHDGRQRLEDRVLDELVRLAAAGFRGLEGLVPGAPLGRGLSGQLGSDAGRLGGGVVLQREDHHDGSDEDEEENDEGSHETET